MRCANYSSNRAAKKTFGGGSFPRKAVAPLVLLPSSSRLSPAAVQATAISSKMRKVNDADRKTIARHLFGKEDDFEAFFSMYDEISDTRNGFTVDINKHRNLDALSHTHVLQVVETLKEDPRKTKNEVISSIQDSLDQPRTSREINNIVDLAVQAMVMVDCSSNIWHSPDYSVGSYRPKSWLPEQQFSNFIDSLFPVLSTPEAGAQRITDSKEWMKAWKLKERLGIKFVGTHNLAEHLLHDEKKGCLYLFHHVGFIKAHLQKQRNCLNPLNRELMDSLADGTLPPQLLIETMHSIQEVMFPSIDEKSRDILDGLVYKRHQSFDPQCTILQDYQVVQQLPAAFEYRYWAQRIAHLHERLLERPPRNKLERWLRWQSSEGNALMVALVALLISIVVGVVSIILSAVQIWIAWMAWKHPSN